MIRSRAKPAAVIVTGIKAEVCIPVAGEEDVSEVEEDDEVELSVLLELLEVESEELLVEEKSVEDVCTKL